MYHRREGAKPAEVVVSRNPPRRLSLVDFENQQRDETNQRGGPVPADHSSARRDERAWRVILLGARAGCLCSVETPGCAWTPSVPSVGDDHGGALSGRPRGLGRMSARSVALTLAVVLATARPAATRSGETSSPRRSSPPPPRGRGRVRHRRRTQLQPGACSTSWTTSPPTPRTPTRRVARHGVRLRRRRGSAGIRPASALPGFAAPRPPACLTASGRQRQRQGGVDARFSADDAVVCSPRRGSGTLGPGLWSRGDPVTSPAATCSLGAHASPANSCCADGQTTIIQSSRRREPTLASPSHPRFDDARP